MDLIHKLASLAQRYEELNHLMARPEVVEDISLLQRYGREHAELEEVVEKYQEIQEVERHLAQAQEMYEGDDLEMRELAYEEMARLKDLTTAVAKSANRPAAQGYHGREKCHRDHPGRGRRR
jgi:peptide chain release factor 1